MSKVEDFETQWRELPAPPAEQGTVGLLVLRKGEGAHETPASVEFSPEGGVHGDRWSAGKAPKLDCQVTLMNLQVARLVCRDQPLHLPGDNVLTDLDLSEANLPVGARLRVGTALLEVTAEPHTGCKKFSSRVGAAALAWINAKPNRARHLRGINCRVVAAGQAAVGDVVSVER